MKRLAPLLACAAAAAALALPCRAEPENEPGTSLSTLALDAEFGQDGVVASARGRGRRLDRFLNVAVDSQGRILVAGDTAAGRTGFVPGVARFLPDGTIDRSFGAGGVASVRFRGELGGLIVDGQDRVLLVGRFAGRRGKVYRAARFTAKGRPDRAFSRDGLLADTVPGTTWLLPRRVAADDGIAVLTVDTAGAFGVLRIGGDGEIPADWQGLLGIVPLGMPLGARDIAVDAQSRVVVGLRDRVIRLRTNGTYDLDFGTVGSLTGPGGRRVGIEPGGLALDAQGRIALRGFEVGDATSSLFRFLPDGTPDPTFSGDGRAVWLYGAPPDSDLSSEVRLAIGDGDAGPWAMAARLRFSDTLGSVVDQGFVVQAIDPSAPGAVASYVVRVPKEPPALNASYQPVHDVAFAPGGAAAFVAGYRSHGAFGSRATFEPQLLRVDLAPRQPVPLPDIQLSWDEEPVEGSRLGGAGFSFHAVVRVTNAGPGPAAEAAVRFVLSDDAEYHPATDDHVLELRTGPIPAGGAYVQSFQSPQYMGVATSGRRILAVVNYDGRQMETDVTNEVLVSAPLE